MKVIFIFDFPFSQYYYERYGIPKLLREGLAVEVWNLMPFLNPKAADHSVPDAILFQGFRTMETEQATLEAIRRTDGIGIFVVLVEYSFKNRAIYQELSRSDHLYGTQISGTLPGVGSMSRRTRGWRLVDLIGSPIRIVNGIFRRIPPRWMNIRCADFIMAGGTASDIWKRIFPLGRQTRWIEAHAFDYDRFLEERDSASRDDPAVPNQPYAVFIDQYLPFHTDNLHLGIPNWTMPEAYYSKLAAFFERVENELNCRVVIAAHPVAAYESLPDYYQGRQIIRGKTIQLVRSARLVLAHDSAALNFANLFRKPVVFLSYLKYVNNVVDSMASSFGKQPIDLDAVPLEIDWEKELMVDNGAYDWYRENFIKKSGSPDKPSWRIFTDFLKTLQ